MKKRLPYGKLADNALKKAVAMGSPPSHQRSSGARPVKVKFRGYIFRSAEVWLGELVARLAMTRYSMPVRCIQTVDAFFCVGASLDLIDTQCLFVASSEIEF
jgi:hypothetical protein